MTKSQSQLAILGAASGLGQKHLGLEFGPAAIRGTGIISALCDGGWLLKDFGDVTTEQGNFDARGVVEKVRLFSLVALREFGKLLLLGGDHSVSVGSIQAALEYYPRLRVVWVDAHGDMNTPESSLTGNLHGMPLAKLLGLFDSDSCSPRLRPEQLCLIGVRSLDPFEEELIARLGIAVFTAQSVRRDGIGAILEKARILDGDEPIHLSFDVDAVDPIIAPATGIHVPDGLLAEEALALCSTLGSRGQLVSMDFTELNPLRAGTPEELDRTLALARDLILTAWCAE